MLQIKKKRNRQKQEINYSVKQNRQTISSPLSFEKKEDH
jgi:hypothetical protein